MNQNKQAPRRRMTRREWRIRRCLRLARNWAVFLAACGAAVALMTSGILWLLPKAHALIAGPEDFVARNYDGTEYQLNLADARLVLVNGNLPLDAEPAPALAVADDATGQQLEAEAAEQYRAMAAAAAALGLDQRLAEYFGATAEQEEFLSTAAVPMNIVKRDSGAVMRIEQVIADRYCAAVLIDFTAPEGTVLDQDYYAFDRSVSATSRDGVKMQTYGIGWEVLPSSTENETGRHATILMTIHSLKGEFNFIGAKVKLTLDGLYRDNWGEELVVPGRWSCTFTLPETDPGRLCTVNEPIEIEGKNAVLTTLYVSPLSLTCEIKQGTDDLKETVEPIYSDDGKESIAPEVTLQNGETVGAADWLFLITNYADKRGRYCFRMDEILDPETVSSVSAFGETFSIE